MHHTLDFPQSRTAPAHVLAGLREVDPTATLVYMGDGRWMLGTVRAHREAIDEARRILDQAIATLHRTAHLTGGKRNIRFDPRTRGRITLALLALQGFRPIHEFTVQGEPTSAIVHAFRQADYLWRTMTAQQAEADWDAEQDAARQAAHADLTDPARARDAYRYAFTLSHLVTPARRDPAAPTASGRTVQRVLTSTAA